MHPGLDLNDLITHRLAWRAALEGMIKLCEQGDDSDGANLSYWQHELAAFDRTFSIFHDGSATPDEAWQNWEGGESPPVAAAAFVVDIRPPVGTAGAGCDDTIWTGPARVADWSEPCRWRISAEQPAQ